MFVEFLYHLRASGISVSTTEWLTLLDVISRGYTKCSLSTFYDVARSCLIKSERLFDRYDQACAGCFRGASPQLDVKDELLSWLENPVLPRDLTDAEKKMLESWDLERLYR